MSTHSIITKHKLKYSHEFDWKNVGILDKERYLSKVNFGDVPY